MASPLLPREIDRRLAAAISCRSLPAFMRDLWPHVGTEGGRVPLSAQERAIGFKITPTKYLEADRQLDARREKQRGYKQNTDHRGPELEVSGGRSRIDAAR
jgi:hypothetical protein